MNILDWATPKIPVDYQRLDAEIFELIESGIWEQIGRDRYKRWISQFETPDERLLGALIVRHLIFRSEKQKKAVLRQAIERGITTLSSAQLRSRRSLRVALSEENHMGREIFFAPVEWKGMPPGKSGQPLIRELKRSFRLNNECLIYGDEFPSIKASNSKARLFFIDDTLGSGHQFEDCLYHNDLLSRAGLLNSIIYIPLMAHERGLKFVSDRYPAVEVWPGEKLTEENDAFALMDRWASDGRLDFQRHPREVYSGICRRHAPFEKTADGESGYEGMTLLLGYDNATPDNSLPLLWDKASTWRPLLIR